MSSLEKDFSDKLLVLLILIKEFCLENLIFCIYSFVFTVRLFFNELGSIYSSNSFVREKN